MSEASKEAAVAGSQDALVRPQGLRRVTIDQILEDAQQESGGDAEESVLINYSILLELIDGYNASGWVREMTPNAPRSATPGGGQ